MKKLMVVAAAAALTGVAVAEDVTIWHPTSIYDLTISVKSTTGKASKGSEKAYTVNLGKDKKDGGNFWYEDACVVNFGKGGEHVNIKTNPYDNNKKERTFGVIGVDGTEFKACIKVTYKSKKLGAALSKEPEIVWSKIADKDRREFAKTFGFNEANGKTRYNYQSANKWCKTFEYKVTVDATCYRVAKSYTYKYLVTAEECCGKAQQFEVYAPDADVADDEPIFPIETIMLYRFNAEQLAKANKVEYIGKVGNFAKANQNWAWAFAGQGDWSDTLTLKYKDGNKKQKGSYSGVKSLSGNIVGSLPPATCEGCCGVDDQAIAFTCNALTDDDIAWKSADDKEMMTTAMFGTFSLKWKKCAWDQY